jgi:hypothetical protein
MPPKGKILVMEGALYEKEFPRLPVCAFASTLRLKALPTPAAKVQDTRESDVQTASWHTVLPILALGV